MISASIPSTRPTVVRVERSFRSSALVWAITAASLRSARGRLLRATSLQRRARAPGRRRRRRRRRPGRSSCHARAVRGRCWSSSRSVRAEAPRQAPSGCGLRTRTEPPTRAVRLLERGLDHQPPPADDQHLIDGLGNLGQHMARDEHSPSLRREGAEEVAEPAHTLRVEPVRRLVEHEQLRIAEERGRRPSRWRIPSEYPLTRRLAAS